MKTNHWLKKALAFILAGIMLLSLVACGSVDDPGSGTNPPSSGSTPAPIDPDTMKDVTLNIRIMNEFKTWTKLWPSTRK